MRLILYTQHHRARTPERQQELDHCLRSNLQHPALDQVIVLREPDAPALPGPSRMEVQQLEEANPLTYSTWIQLLSQEQDAIGILINADIALGKGFERLPEALNTADSALALSHYNPLGESKPATLNQFPHWTQHTWALRSDAPITQSLLYASSFPISIRGCDNRIAHTLWTHGLVVKNPCHHLETIHHQANEHRNHNEYDDHLYGGVSYVHPSLNLEDASELDHALWTRNPENGQRLAVAPQLPVLNESRQKLRLRLTHQTGENIPNDDPLELLTFTEKDESRATAAAPATMEASRPFHLHLQDRRLEASKVLAGQTWEELHRYSERFVLQRREGRIAFVDRHWLTAVTFRDPELDEWSSEALREAFVWGFTGPALEWKAQQFSTEKLYAEQLNFWQYPCRTEQDALERHQRMEEPYWNHDGVHLYVGMPWATWIDKNRFPDQLLEAYRSRIRAMQELLGEPMHVHSVCQHIHWKKHLHRFEQAGINQLWIAHKEKGWNTEGQLQLHSWPLYAVNVLDPNRRQGLELIPIEKKTIFASFKGAHMRHYLSDIRLRLKELQHLKGYEIEVTNLWHFYEIVYDHQVNNKETGKEDTRQQEIYGYNKLLSQSLFSLCPAGSGPNTLRLWESLGNGTIPVVLSDHYEFPAADQPTEAQAVVNIKENDYLQIPEILSRLSTKQQELLQANGTELFKNSRALTCFPTNPKHSIKNFDGFRNN